MQTTNLTQGSPEWLAHRRTHFNASDAPAMMGCSPHKTRTQLLHEIHTGLVPEVDAATQRRFDDGHRFEALARALAEAIVYEDLFPVTGTKGKLSASFDGLTMDESTAFEHKMLNKNLRNCMNGQSEDDASYLPLFYRAQMEQQLMVSGAARCLFMATQWDGNALVEELHCWYKPDTELRAHIEAGWSQFEQDLAAYVPVKVVMPATAIPQLGLPALYIQVKGSIDLIENLEPFGVALNECVSRINQKPETDQDFANLEATVKTLKAAEEALDAAENGALAQTASIDTMRKTVALYREIARTNRLLADKLVKVEKDNRRTEIVSDGGAKFAAHMNSLNQRIGKSYMPHVATDFAGAVKGKRTIDTLREAVTNELTRAKIEASAIADRISLNMGTLRELAASHTFLFADTSHIVLKQPDDLTALVKLRIAEHQAAEAAKEEVARERIRSEELARIAHQAAQAENIETVTPAKPDMIRFGNILIPREQVDKTWPAKPLPVTPPELKLGQIADRLGFILTAAFLGELGFEPVATERASKLYHEHSFPLICAALVAHIEAVQGDAYL